MTSCIIPYTYSCMNHCSHLHNFLCKYLHKFPHIVPGIHLYNRSMLTHIQRRMCLYNRHILHNLHN